MALAPAVNSVRGPRVVAIPLYATRSALEPLLPAIAERQRAVLESGRYIRGPEVEAFESEFAAFVGRRHCIGVANGTEALTIALRALGVRPGDEVIVPGISFFATAEAVVNAGAQPAFADIDAETHCLTAATVEPVLTSRTRALVPVHLFGNPAPMGELVDLARSRGLVVLEDAAQAAGASYEGSLCRRARRRGLVQLLPRKEPRRSRRCGGDPDRRRGGGVNSANAACTRPERSVGSHRGRLQLAPRPNPKPQHCGCYCPTSEAGRRPGATWLAPTSGRGSAIWSIPSGKPRVVGPHITSTSCEPSPATRSAPRCER